MVSSHAENRVSASAPGRLLGSRKSISAALAPMSNCDFPLAFQPELGFLPRVFATGNAPINSIDYVESAAFGLLRIRVRDDHDYEGSGQ